MSVLSIAPAAYYADGDVQTGTWSDADGKINRSIRTDIALDNSVVVSDSGFSWGSMSMRLEIPYSAGTWRKLGHWLEGWPYLVVCRPEGVFSVILINASIRKGKIYIQLSVTNRLAGG